MKLDHPKSPFDASAREWVDFCLDFQTVAGFIAVFEQTWKEEFSSLEKHKGASYEKVEKLYSHLFGQRRYNDREVFYSARSRHYKQTR
ncbi:hypothetical protein [Spirosoma linguale]|uniref:Uncharacterized protein n=1 Tax=Spirosoma linguale (strain ATCC 33905 / DSM 74 / LMG 10896 / Claus 1) TaxID=504472 RepID=D2QNA9_SPILD|nr:hypothetical protein Slin_3287 [Spirosoma linguale DSM 74]